MGGSINQNELNIIKKKYSNIFNKLKIFLETGTYQAESLITASLFFEKLYTIEINKILYNFSLKKVEQLNIKNTIHYLGDSVKVIDTILDEINEPTFFFLDAHTQYIQTSDPTVLMNNGDYITPLLKELNIINEKYPQIPAIICIDDVRLWVNKCPDWEGVSFKSIINTMSKHKINDSFEYNDRFYLIINNE